MHLGHLTYGHINVCRQPDGVLNYRSTGKTQLCSDMYAHSLHYQTRTHPHLSKRIQTYIHAYKITSIHTKTFKVTEQSMRIHVFCLKFSETKQRSFVPSHPHPSELSLYPALQEHS